MRFVKTFLLISAFICSCNVSHQSNFSSDISINIKLQESDSVKGVVPFACIMDVEQKISLKSGNIDTVSLILVYPKIFPVSELGVRNVKVSSSDTDVPSSFVNDTLTFRTVPGCIEYIIRYEVNASCFMSNGFSPENCVAGDFYIYDHSSWYFTSPEMELNVSSIGFSDSLYVISSGIHIDNTESDEFKKPKQRLDVIALHKRFYSHLVKRIDDCTCNIYLRSFASDKLQIDTVLKKRNKYNAEYFHVSEFLPDSVLDFKGNYIEKCLQLAHSLFDYTPDTLNVIECLWGNDSYSGGRTVSNNLTVVDTLFISDHSGSLVHEMLHVCDILDYHLLCEDNSVFFFSESMIDYLTKYLIKEEPGFSYKAWDLNDSGLKKENLKNIFEIEANNKDTQYTIYVYSPHVIDQFANRIGEKRFVDLYNKFHHDCIENESLSFKAFLDYYKQNGIPQDVLNEFVASLSSIK